MEKFKIKKRFTSGPLIKDISEIYDADELEKVVKVDAAKVVIADYKLLINDFKDVFEHPDFKENYSPHFCGKCKDCSSKEAKYCQKAIDQWLINNAAYVSEQQTKPNDVNSPISHGEVQERGYRPPRYGRALVMPIDEHVSDAHAKFLDVKGTGVGEGKIPTNDRHANGLDYLGIALSDFFYAWLVNEVFASTVDTYSVVPIYAVIDLGFDLKDYIHGTAPAGLHIRRAHHRSKGLPLHNWGSDAEKTALHMEMILRSFGLTSTAPSLSLQVCEHEGKEYLQRSSGFVFNYIDPKDEQWHGKLLDLTRGRRMDIVNIQFANELDFETGEAQIVDFGLFDGSRNFEMPICTTSMDRPFFVGRTIAPEDPAYLRPVKELALDPELVNRAAVNGISFYAANSFRYGSYSSEDITNMMRIGIVRAWGKRKVMSL